MTSTFTARGIAAVFSGVHANPPISPCQYVSKALTSTWEKYGFSLVHTQRSATIARPIPMPQSKWQYGRVLCVQ